MLSTSAPSQARGINHLWCNRCEYKWHATENQVIAQAWFWIGAVRARQYIERERQAALEARGWDSTGGGDE